MEEEKQKEEEHEERMLELNRRVRSDLPLSHADLEAWRRWSENVLSSSSSAGKRRKRKKRRKRRLPRTSSLRGTRLQGAYAKVTGLLFTSSSCSSGACGKHVLQAFVQRGAHMTLIVFFECFCAFSQSVWLDVSAHFSALDGQQLLVLGVGGPWESDSQVFCLIGCIRAVVWRSTPL